MLCSGFTPGLLVRFAYPCRISDMTHDNTAGTMRFNPATRSTGSSRGYVRSSGYVRMSYRPPPVERSKWVLFRVEIRLDPHGAGIPLKEDETIVSTFCYIQADSWFLSTLIRKMPPRCSQSQSIDCRSYASPPSSASSSSSGWSLMPK